jgi:putative transcriptional regulator
MVGHDATGAMGLVVNRPLGDMPLERLLELFGGAGAGASGSVRVFSGGPVELGRGFVLHTVDWAGPGTRAIGGGFALTAHPAILDALRRGTGPRRSLLAFGYAGWAPRQLEGEIQRGAWISVPADETLVFDEDDTKKWERAVARGRLSI